MGRYIQWDDVTNRYKRYGDIVNAEDSEDIYIGYAEAYIDSSLARAFTVPFSSNNTLVKDLCIDIAFAKTMMFKDEKKADAIYTHVNSIISALISGKMTMVTTSGEAISMTGEPVYSSNMDYIPVFGKGDIKDFKVDSSQLYDEEIDRDF